MQETNRGMLFRQDGLIYAQSGAEGVENADILAWSMSLESRFVNFNEEVPLWDNCCTVIV